MFFGVPIVMAYNLFACILRALGDGKTPLHAMIVASFVNIALDLLFVLVFHWGIAGAAVATLIAQLVSSLFCLWHPPYRYSVASQGALPAAPRHGQTAALPSAPPWPSKRRHFNRWHDRPVRRKRFRRDLHRRVYGDQ